MAGYIFLLDNLDSLEFYSRCGLYSTKVGAPRNGRWGIPQEGTFADYSTMSAGDNIYFFIKRRVYGIGRLVDLENDCKFLNFPHSGNPENFEYEQIREQLLWDEGGHSIGQRWVCIFEPDPYFFLKGVDMDDVLSSNPAAFKMLRALWKLSFIKFDEVENQAFRDILLKRNQDALLNPLPNENTFLFDDYATHRNISEKLNAEYSLDLAPILDTCNDGQALRHEMAIEAGLLSQLSNQDEGTMEIFGFWDYLSHQVIASPFKPIDYMDKMDVFGYSYIEGYKPTISRLLVVEIKKDSADCDSIDQILKYVDWVNEEYSFGDYGMIEAYLIAYEFSQDVIDYADETGKRNYIIGRRPAKQMLWEGLKLISYRYDNAESSLNFLPI